MLCVCYDSINDLSHNRPSIYRGSMVVYYCQLSSGSLLQGYRKVDSMEEEECVMDDEERCQRCINLIVKKRIENDRRKERAFSSYQRTMSSSTLKRLALNRIETRKLKSAPFGFEDL